MKQLKAASSPINILKEVLKRGNHDHPVASENDFIYRRRFLRFFSPKLYRQHTEAGYVSCAFCKNLAPSYCHNGCYFCTKKTYDMCDLLIPGIVRREGNSRNLRRLGVPWLFKIPCKEFERLGLHNYMRNFTYGSKEIATNSFEILEGLFSGISNGGRPCHICAAVDSRIFEKCPQSRQSNDGQSCINIFENVLQNYMNMQENRS